MTKVRPPASFFDAITRIAGLIGWDGCVEALTAGTGRKLADRTVRNWSDPDTEPCISIEDALKLDLAYQAQGGYGTPLFDAYAHQLERETERARLNQPCLISATAAAAKETGEAMHAMVLAASPHANANDKARAGAEIVEAIDALQKSLIALDLAPTSLQEEAAR